MTDAAASDTRAYELDFLRIFSCVSVLILHITGEAWSTLPLHSASWLFANALITLAKQCVPCFFMISGALFLDPKHNAVQQNNPLRQIPWKNILRIMTAFLFWSALYVLVDNVLPMGKITASSIYYFLVPQGHLWFLYTLIGLYLITPLLRSFCHSRWSVGYFVVLGFVFSVCPNILYLFPGMQERFARTISDNSFLCGLGYSVYFVMGYYLRTWRVRGKGRVLLYGAGLFSLLWMLVGTTTASFQAGRANEPYFEYLSPFVFCYSAAVYQLFLDCFSFTKPTGAGRKLVLLLSKLSFGVYLSHIWILVNVRRYLHLYAWMSPSPLFTLLIVLVVYVLSLTITWIISKIPILKRYII